MVVGPDVRLEARATSRAAHITVIFGSSWTMSKGRMNAGRFRREIAARPYFPCSNASTAKLVAASVMK